jgi:hypothetical protein
MTKKPSKDEIHKMRCRIMAYDITAILDDADRGEFSYLHSILMGDGYTQPGRMTDVEVLREWKEGEYAGEDKAYLVENSPSFRHPFIQHLWKNGSDGGTHCTGKVFKPRKS